MSDWPTSGRMVAGKDMGCGSCLAETNSPPHSPSSPSPLHYGGVKWIRPVDVVDDPGRHEIPVEAERIVVLDLAPGRFDGIGPANHSQPQRSGAERIERFADRESEADRIEIGRASCREQVCQYV